MGAIYALSKLSFEEHDIEKNDAGFSVVPGRKQHKKNALQRLGQAKIS